MQIDDYAANMIDRVEIIKKNVLGDRVVTGIRLHLYTPHTIVIGNGCVMTGKKEVVIEGPYIECGGDITGVIAFWDKEELYELLKSGIKKYRGDYAVCQSNN